IGVRGSGKSDVEIQEEMAAATKLQSTYRGYRTRKELETQRSISGTPQQGKRTSSEDAKTIENKSSFTLTNDKPQESKSLIETGADQIKSVLAPLGDLFGKLRGSTEESPYDTVTTLLRQQHPNVVLPSEHVYENTSEKSEKDDNLPHSIPNDDLQSYETVATLPQHRVDGIPNGDVGKDHEYTTSDSYKTVDAWQQHPGIKLEIEKQHEVTNSVPIAEQSLPTENVRGTTNTGSDMVRI
ncbi:unnamed protein product, partial [Didymodactylos carnosus]